ncbi:MAG: helix-turn-helix transcriptional regulator [Saccharospirillaceae bacterium]|nr:helix-turn-helix domain-containing protein [Pseudomonadales bacterium]NRB80343.1 helix-turn-helix transcriptional regulator [Saccharospirillaceae bacterium]
MSSDQIKPILKKITLRKRVSQNSESVSTQEREQLMLGILNGLLMGEMTQGQALMALRINVLNMKQNQYAQLIKLSIKTLSDLEQGKGNMSQDTVNQAFRPFGLTTSIVPIKKSLIMDALNYEFKS